MTLRSTVLAAFAALTAWSVLFPAWRLHIRQKGDDLYLPWKSAPLWAEDSFHPQDMADYATQRLGFPINPADIEPMLDTQRAYLQLAGLAVGGLFVFLMLLDRRPAPTGSGTPPS